VLREWCLSGTLGLLVLLTLQCHLCRHHGFVQHSCINPVLLLRRCCMEVVLPMCCGRVQLPTQPTEGRQSCGAHAAAQMA